MEQNLRWRILLVEDNPDHAELIQRLFEDHHISNQIHHVTSGEEALNYLYHTGGYRETASSPRPHLILLDLRLPKIDGLEVLRHIKLQQPETLTGIPVVVLTSSAATSDLEKAYSLKANSYLLKPVDYDQFNRLIDELGHYWLGLNTQPQILP
jgi:CheY-like chemotaxis protein